VLPYTKENYEALFRAGGREDLLDDERIASRQARVANSDSLYRDVASFLPRRTTDDWLALCAQIGVPATRAATLEDLVEALPEAVHPHAGRYRTIPPPVRFSGTPASVRRPAPLVGEQGRTLLSELGYQPQELDALEAAGVLRSPQLEPAVADGDEVPDGRPVT
jgi:crotonobetainyl-CoA:carnitine CoA-transferase CaiB-like acyl-CoA transferase